MDDRGVTDDDDRATDDDGETNHGGPTPNGPWTRRSRRIAYENPWVTVWHDEVTRPDGSPGIYGVVHFANLAAGVLVLDENDRVLLVGQHRYPLDEYAWEIPEGGVPSGETAIEGARRELREETGVEATEWRELARVHLSNSVSDEVAVLFVATGLTHGIATPDATEDLEVQWLPFEAVLEMTLDGRISDAMTVIAVERYALLRATGRTGRSVGLDSDRCQAEISCFAGENGSAGIERRRGDQCVGRGQRLSGFAGIGAPLTSPPGRRGTGVHVFQIPDESFDRCLCTSDSPGPELGGRDRRHKGVVSVVMEPIEPFQRCRNASEHVDEKRRVQEVPHVSV